jgi:RNA polymerase sigma-70 factor (ECF subfamily)
MTIFYERHKAMVGRLARANGLSDDDARELVQETFVRAWRSAAAYRGEASATSWLRGIVRHLIADHIDAAVRSRKLFVAQEVRLGGDEPSAADAATPEPGPERLAELAQAKHCIDQCLGKLSVPHREVLALRVCGAELKEQEVARLLEVPIGTVKSRTSIALRLLATCVERCAGIAHV